jgi:hypothetical protein
MCSTARPLHDGIGRRVAVIAINAWNRLAVTFRPAVGNYKPAAVTTAAAAPV